tara:strand:+ start:38 stop:265 length:228 start_codon:yes stop_codon:yes gene_type:complete
MFEIDKNLQTAIVIFILACLVFYKTKPKIFFKRNGEFKDFGVGGGDKTTTPFWLVTLVIGLFSYLYICVRNDDFV